MELEEHIERMKQFRKLLEVRMPDFVATAAMDLKAMIQHRTQEAGKIGDEEIVQIYMNEAYKRKRKERGRQTEYVDLTFTRGGAGMFGSTGIVLEEQQPGLARVVVGGKDEFTQQKLDWNSDRYGDILAPAKEEIDFIEKQFDKFLELLAEEAGVL